MKFTTIRRFAWNVEMFVSEPLRTGVRKPFIPNAKPIAKKNKPMMASGKR